MKKIYIHIGMGKTGTTALQHFFSHNAEQLAKFGVDYPNYCTIEGAHHRLSPHIPPFLKDVWEYIDVQQWAPELSKSKLDKILISSELISSLKPNLISDFHSEINKYFDTKIIIYIRSQDQILCSAYNQQIKAGILTAPFLTMAERQFERFNYLNVIEPWASAFGERNIIVVKYDYNDFFERDIRKDFLNKIFDIRFFDDFKFENIFRNLSFSYGAAEFKRLINSIIGDSVEANRFNPILESYTQDPSGAGKFPSRKPCSNYVLRQILNRYRKSNSEIANKYLPKHDGYLFNIYEAESGIEEPEPILFPSEIADIIEYIGNRDGELVKVLEDKISLAISENRFEARLAIQQMRDGLEGAGFEKAGGTRTANMTENMNAANMKYPHEGRNANGKVLLWNSDNEFELGGCRFTIDLTSGSKRRPSEEGNFTIVKTKKFLQSYLDISLNRDPRILEFGIFQGGSLVFMERLFEPRKIVGIELSKEPVTALETFKSVHAAVATYYGVSQDDKNAVQQIIETELDGAIDLIVDDASHLYEQTKKSFEASFPYLVPGGLYIIEDWAWSFRPAHQSKESTWFDKAAMANLIFQIVGDIASNDAIDSIFIKENLAIIKKSNREGRNPPLEIRNYRGRDWNLI